MPRFTLRSIASTFCLAVCFASITGSASAQTIYLNQNGSVSSNQINVTGAFAYNASTAAYDYVFWVVVPVPEAPDVYHAANVNYGYALGAWDGYEMAFDFNAGFLGLDPAFVPPAWGTGAAHSGTTYGLTKRYAIYLANQSLTGTIHPYFQCYYLVDVRQSIFYNYTFYSDARKPPLLFSLPASTDVVSFVGPFYGGPYCGP